MLASDMGALTEIEIFTRMQESLRLAAECCDDLAVSNVKGPTYDALRKHLLLIEGCCRQASAWREDSRWLPIGIMMAQAHKRAGNWLRGFKVQGEVLAIKLDARQHNRNFVHLAANLRAIYAAVENLKTQKTGRVGMILPEQAPAPFRETKQHAIMLPPGMARRDSGLLVPAGTA